VAGKRHATWETRGRSGDRQHSDNSQLTTNGSVKIRPANHLRQRRGPNDRHRTSGIFSGDVAELAGRLPRPVCYFKMIKLPRFWRGRLTAWTPTPTSPGYLSLPPAPHHVTPSLPALSSGYLPPAAPELAGRRRGGTLPECQCQAGAARPLLAAPAHGTRILPIHPGNVREIWAAPLPSRGDVRAMPMPATPCTGASYAQRQRALSSRLAPSPE